MRSHHSHLSSLYLTEIAGASCIHSCCLIDSPHWSAIDGHGVWWLANLFLDECDRRILSAVIWPFDNRLLRFGRSASSSLDVPVSIWSAQSRLPKNPRQRDVCKQEKFRRNLLAHGEYAKRLSGANRRSVTVGPLFTHWYASNYNFWPKMANHLLAPIHSPNSVGSTHTGLGRSWCPNTYKLR